MKVNLVELGTLEMDGMIQGKKKWLGAYLVLDGLSVAGVSNIVWLFTLRSEAVI